MKQLVCSATQRGVKFHCSEVFRTLHDDIVKPQGIDIEEDLLPAHIYHQYRIAIHGLAAFPKRDVEKMTPVKKGYICSLYKRAQAVINRMKNEIVDQIQIRLSYEISGQEGSVVLRMPRCEVAYALPNPLSFSELGMSKEMISNRLLREGIIHH